MSIINRNSTAYGASAALRALGREADRGSEPANPLGRPSWRTVLLLALTALFTLATPGPAGAQTFTDNSFTSGWTTFVYYQNPATPAATAVANPFPSITPSRRRLTHSYYTGMAMYARHLNSLQTYAPSSGRITNIRFQYTLQTTNIQVGYAPMIEQGGNLYSTGWNPANSGGGDLHPQSPGGELQPDPAQRHARHQPASRLQLPREQDHALGHDTGPAIRPRRRLQRHHLDQRSQRRRVDITAEPCAPTMNPCCTPLTNAAVKDQLRLYQPGTVGTNYTFFIIPSAPYMTQFSAYINYLHAINPAITTFTVTWTITDQGNGILPQTVAGPPFTSATNSWVCTTTPGCPSPPAPVPFTGLLFRRRTAGFGSPPGRASTTASPSGTSSVRRRSSTIICARYPDHRRRPWSGTGRAERTGAGGWCGRRDSNRHSPKEKQILKSYYRMAKLLKLLLKMP